MAQTARGKQIQWLVVAVCAVAIAVVGVWAWQAWSTARRALDAVATEGEPAEAAPGDRARRVVRFGMAADRAAEEAGPGGATPGGPVVDLSNVPRPTKELPLTPALRKAMRHGRRGHRQAPAAVDPMVDGTVDAAPTEEVPEGEPAAPEEAPLEDVQQE